MVEAPAVIVNHAALEAAVQEKSGALAVTVMVLPFAPAAGAVSLAGVIVTLPVRPLWMRVKVWPPTVIVPVREAMVLAVEYE